MTRDQLLDRLQRLSDDEFVRLAPFLEADLDALADIPDLHAEIEAGRMSAATEPLLNAGEVYDRARKALSK